MYRMLIECALLVTTVLVHFSFAQGTAPSNKATPSESSDPHPVAMTECEGINNCASWTFLGTQGNGKWPSGDEASLIVENYDNGSVTIRRADSSGASAGLSAVYTGTRDGTSVGGKVNYSWPGHPQDKKSGFWYAMIDAPRPLPTVMHFCDVNCITLQLQNGHYVSTTRYPWESQDYSSTWTVESFEPRRALLHRVDTGSYAFTADYKGEMSADGNALVNAANPFANLPNQPATVRLAWGANLGTVPGSNNDRDGSSQARIVVLPVAAPTVCIPWFFGLICN